MSNRSIRLKEFALNQDFTTNPEENYRAARNGIPELRDYRIRTEGNGFILSGDFRSPRKLVGLGDSIMECMFVEEGCRVCARIEAELDFSVQVLNGGCSGATSLHILNTIANKVVPLRPAGIFVMTGIMDVEAMCLANGFWTNDVHMKPIFDASDHNGGRDTDFVEMNVTQRLQLTNCIIDFCRNFGIPVCFISTPHLQRYDGYYVTHAYSEERYGDLTRKRGQANYSISQLCLAKSVPFYDVQMAFADRPDLFHDDKHMNEKGTSVFSEELKQQSFFRLLQSWC